MSAQVQPRQQQLPDIQQLLLVRSPRSLCPALRSPHTARQFSQEKPPRAEGPKRARAAGQIHFRHQPEYVPHTPIRYSFPLPTLFRPGSHYRKWPHPPACPKWLCPLNTLISRFPANPNTILPRTCEPSPGTNPSFQTFISGQRSSRTPATGNESVEHCYPRP